MITFAILPKQFDMLATGNILAFFPSKTFIHPQKCSHQIIQFCCKSKIKLFEIEKWQRKENIAKTRDSIHNKVIKGKFYIELIIGKELHPFDGASQGTPFHNIEVYNADGQFLSATSWKRARKFIEKKKAIIRTHSPFSIQLTEKNNLASHNPLRYLGENLPKNQCEVCHTLENLTKHHIWPVWHPASILKNADDCTFNTAILCRACHQQVEKFYTKKLSEIIGEEDEIFREEYKQIAIENAIDFEKLYQEFLFSR